MGGQIMAWVLAGGFVALLLAHPSLYSREHVYIQWSRIALLGWLIVLAEERHRWKQLLLSRKILGPLALLVGGTVLTGAFYPDTSWMDLPTLGAQLLFLWIGWWLGREQELTRFLGIAVLVGGGVVGGYGLLQHLQVDPLPAGTPFVDRVVSVFENPNHFGNFLASLLPLGLATFLWARTWRTHLASLILVGLIYGGLLVAASRGAWWAALAGVLVLSAGYLYQVYRRVTQVYWGWVGALLLLLSALTFLLSTETVIQGPAGPVSVQERMSSSTNIVGAGVQQDSSINHRYYIWQVTWEMIRQHPLLGNGYGTYAQRFVEVRQALQERGAFPVQGWTSSLDAPYAHNEYLQVWAESGLVGLVGFVGLMVVVVTSTVRTGWQARSPALALWGALGLVAVMLVDSLVNYPLRLPLNSTLFWLVLGVLAHRGTCKASPP